MGELSLRAVDTPITKEGLRTGQAIFPWLLHLLGPSHRCLGPWWPFPPSGLSESVHPLVVMPLETLPSSQAHSNCGDRGTSPRVTKNNGNDADLAAELGLRDGLTSRCPDDPPPRCHIRTLPLKSSISPEGEPLEGEGPSPQRQSAEASNAPWVSASLWKSMGYDCKPSLCLQLPSASWIFSGFSPWRPPPWPGTVVLRTSLIF